MSAMVHEEGVCMKTKIKICGLKTPEEAKKLNPSDIDFMGIVLFFPKSRRSVSIEQAEKILGGVPSGIKKTAVTVSPTLEQVQAIEKAGFDYLQVHGKLFPEILENTSIPVIRAVNIRNGVPELEKNDRIRAYLFDAAEPGSGKPFDWNALSRLSRDGMKWVLAGGLNPDNVGEAIRRVHPDMVDVSSSVEKPEGGKDFRKVSAFVRAVREAD